MVMEHTKKFTRDEFAAHMQGAGFVAVWKFLKDHGDKPLSVQREILKAWGLIVKSTSGWVSPTPHQEEAYRDLEIP